MANDDKKVKKIQKKITRMVAKLAKLRIAAAALTKKKSAAAGSTKKKGAGKKVGKRKPLTRRSAAARAKSATAQTTASAA